MNELSSSQCLIDKINKFFAVLAKVHAVTYMFTIGTFTAVLYVYLAEPQIHKVWLIRIGYVGIFTMFAYFFLTKLFYERYELGRKYLPTTNSGWVIRDTYFYTKINSSITRPKKLLGYLYVVIRIAHAGFFGFVLVLMPLLWIKKLWGL